MKRINTSTMFSGVWCCLMILTLGSIVPLGSRAFAQSPVSNPHCVQIGGMAKVNFIAENTTLGDATGDLKGSVSGTILSVSEGNGGTLIFKAQHRWVTEAGDIIDSAEPTQAVAVPLGPHAPGVFGFTFEENYTGRTGRFEGATVQLKVFGAVDLNRGEAVFRYRGEICFEAKH